MDNRIPYASDVHMQLKHKGFTAYEIKSENYVFQYYNRKEFYKICLNTGKHLIHYADRTLLAQVWATACV